MPSNWSASSMFQQHWACWCVSIMELFLSLEQGWSGRRIKGHWNERKAESSGFLVLSRQDVLTAVVSQDSAVPKWGPAHILELIIWRSFSVKYSCSSYSTWFSKNVFHVPSPEFHMLLKLRAFNNYYINVAWKNKSVTSHDSVFYNREDCTS